MNQEIDEQRIVLKEEESVKKYVLVSGPCKSRNDSFWQKHIGEIAVVAILVPLVGLFWASNEGNFDRMNDQYKGIRSVMTTEFGNIRNEFTGEFRSVRDEIGGVREELHELGKGVARLERRFADSYRYEASESKIDSNTQP